MTYRIRELEDKPSAIGSASLFISSSESSGNSFKTELRQLTQGLEALVLGPVLFIQGKGLAATAPPKTDTSIIEFSNVDDWDALYIGADIEIGPYTQSQVLLKISRSSKTIKLSNVTGIIPIQTSFSYKNPYYSTIGFDGTKSSVFDDVSLAILGTFTTLTNRQPLVLPNAKADIHVEKEESNGGSFYSRKLKCHGFADEEQILLTTQGSPLGIKIEPGQKVLSNNIMSLFDGADVLLINATILTLEENIRMPNVGNQSGSLTVSSGYSNDIFIQANKEISFEHSVTVEGSLSYNVSINADSSGRLYSKGGIRTSVPISGFLRADKIYPYRQYPMDGTRSQNPAYTLFPFPSQLLQLSSYDYSHIKIHDDLVFEPHTESGDIYYSVYTVLDKDTSNMIILNKSIVIPIEKAFYFYYISSSPLDEPALKYMGDSEVFRRGPMLKYTSSSLVRDIPHDPFFDVPLFCAIPSVKNESYLIDVTENYGTFTLPASGIYLVTASVDLFFNASVGSSGIGLRCKVKSSGGPWKNADFVFENLQIKGNWFKTITLTTAVYETLNLEKSSLRIEVYGEEVSSKNRIHILNTDLSIVQA